MDGQCSLLPRSLPLEVDRIYNLRDAGRVMNRSRQYLVKIIRGGRLVAYRDDAGYYILGSDIARYIQSCFVK